MRNRKEIEIHKEDGNFKKVYVKELTVKEILELGGKFQESGSSELSIETLKGALDNNLSMVVEGLTTEELLELAPSDIQKLFEAFKEVNSSFLVIAREVGLIQMLSDLKATIKESFLGSYAALLKQGT